MYFKPDDTDFLTVWLKARIKILFRIIKLYTLKKSEGQIFIEFTTCDIDRVFARSFGTNISLQKVIE